MSDNFHLIRFAPAGSLIEFSPKGEFFGGRRGRIRDFRILNKISIDNLLPISVRYSVSRRDCIRQLFLSRPSPIACNNYRRYRASYFIPYLLRSQIGVIKSFSVRSRSRLNKKIATVRKNHIPHFVTLTYHRDWPSDFHGFKRHLDYFCKAIFWKFPRAGLIWKLEYQKRGAPHFHLMIWGVDLAELQDFVPDKWHKIAGYNSTYHLAWHRGELGGKNEHCVSKILSWGGVSSYAAKYMSKIDDVSHGGRVWGVRGYIPFSPISTYRVDLDVALDFRERLAKSRNYEFQRLGFWCGDFSADWLLVLDLLIDDYHVCNNPPDDPLDCDDMETPDFVELELCEAF